jgi:carboxymethylenebutenolidase
MSLDSINDIQRYLGEETIEQHRDGALSRREMMTRLIAICGSAAGATALLAACGDDGSTSSASTTAGGGSTTAAGGSTTAAPSTTAATGTTAAAPGLATSPPTTAGSGAVLSVSETDTAVKGEDVTFPGSGVTVIGYFARPAGGTNAKRPGVIVIHENQGLTAHIKDVTRRLAKAGYLALAVDLLSRQGGTAKAAAGSASGLLGQLSGTDAVADMSAGITYLESQSDYNGKVGVVGFCYGGGMTMRLAANQPKIKAAVPYYGTPPAPESQMANTSAAILAHYGANDSRVNGTIPTLEANLTGKTYEKRIWENSNHAFNNDTGGNYNANSAVRAWTDTLSWFARHLA